MPGTRKSEVPQGPTEDVVSRREKKKESRVGGKEGKEGEGTEKKEKKYMCGEIGRQEVT